MATVDRLSEFHKTAEKFPAPPPPPPPPLAQAATDQHDSSSKRGKKSKKAKRKSQRYLAPPPLAAPQDLLKMDEFFSQVEEIKDSLSKIESACDAVDVAHQIIINSVSEEEIREQEAVIAAFIDNTNRLSIATRRTLQEMADKTGVLAPIAPPGSGDLRMRRANYAGLLQQFSNSMKRLRDIEQYASTKHQAQVERQYKIMNPEANQREIDRVTGAVGSMTLTSQQIFSLGQTINPLETLERMKERRKEVMAIEKGINALNQLFIDLNNIVESQQGLLDNLEDFLGEAVEYTEEGEVHMQEAVETQRNIRKVIILVPSSPLLNVSTLCSCDAAFVEG